MTKVEKQRRSEAQYMDHMRIHAKHPNREYMKDWLYHLFTGVGLTPEYLSGAYEEIHRYLARDLSRVDPCLHSLECHKVCRGEEIIDTWLSLESDGTREEHSEGERYRLTLDEVKNLWMLVLSVTG